MMGARAKFILIALIFLFGIDLHAQGIPYQLNPPAPNARVQFCPVPDGGYPCPTLTTVYSDSATTQIINQPISTGSSGNLSVYFAVGTSSVTVQLLGQGYGPQNRFVVSLGGGSGGSFATNLVDAVTQGAKFDGVIYYDVTTTNTSPTVTCPNSDCAFTAVMVGRQSWVVNNNGCNAANQCTPIIGAVGSAPPTVVSVASANSITLSANANAGCAAACAIIVADDDTTAITNGYNAAALKCGTYQMPAGIAIVNSAIFGPATTNCTVFAAVGSRQATTVKGFGSSATILVPSINFNMASCTAGGFAACFGSPSTNAHGLTLSGFSIYGMGLNMGAGANSTNGISIGGTGQNYAITDVQLLHWNEGSSSSVGLNINGGVTILNNVQVDGFNQTACQFGNQVLVQGQWFCGDTPFALSILGNALVSTYGGQYCAVGGGGAQVAVGASATWNSFGELFTNCGGQASQKFINGAAMTVSLIGDQIIENSSSNTGISFTGGSVSMLDTTMSVAGATSNCFNTAGSPTFINLGGNTMTCTGLVSGGGLTIVADGHSVKGACTGVVTAASTLGLYGTGPNETLTTCTSTTIGSGIVVSGVRTLYGLVATAGTGGVNASSGVVTVLQNGNATAITCTLGTGTSCNDGTHSVTTADGDLISLRFTTQAADTLANVKAVIAW